MSSMASHIISLTIAYSTVYSRRSSKKITKLRVIGLCEGNPPVTGEFPTQRTCNAKNASIWWRLHEFRRNPDTGLDNALVPSGNRSSPAQIMTQIKGCVSLDPSKISKSGWWGLQLDAWQLCNSLWYGLINSKLHINKKNIFFISHNIRRCHRPMF